MLFNGINEKEITLLMNQLNAVTKKYTKGTEILHAGDCARSLGIIISGKVQIENNDFWGNKSILDIIGTGHVFAESYACMPDEPMMVSVIAAANCEIMFLNVLSLLNKPVLSRAETLFIGNLLKVSNKKNLHLSSRIFHTSSKTIRGRLISYLSAQAAIHNAQQFDINFDRQQLADYLNVDRSALSAELSRMKADGLIDFKKNHFVLHHSTL